MGKGYKWAVFSRLIEGGASHCEGIFDTFKEAVDYVASCGAEQADNGYWYNSAERYVFEQVTA